LRFQEVIVAKPPKDPPTPEDDVRRQFKEALERKQKHPGAAHEGIEGEGKSNAARSNDKSQRMFRRKSGG
jgi:hypothetical protein